MAAVVGYLIAVVIAIAAALLVVGPIYDVRRDPTFELEDVSARQVPILGALAGFAVTGLVFLVTQLGSVPDPTGVSFTTVLTMFVVAYMGCFSSSILFANVSHQTDTQIFDLAAAQYAGASISLFSVFLGWFALKPLFETFGLSTAAGVTGWLLVGAVVVGYGLLANALHRSGYASVRTTLLLPIIAMVVTVSYLVVVGALAPNLRSADATLNLTIVAFVCGVPAYGAMTILPMMARRKRLAPVLAERWHLPILAYAEGVMVLTGFLLLAVFGLA